MSLAERLEALREQEEGLGAEQRAAAIAEAWRQCCHARPELVDLAVLDAWWANLSQELDTAGPGLFTPGNMNVLLQQFAAERAAVDDRVERANANKIRAQELANAIQEEKAALRLDPTFRSLRLATAYLNSIRQRDIVEIKVNRRPVDIIKLVFDAVLILQRRPVVAVAADVKFINKVEAPFIRDSFAEHGSQLVCDIRFLADLLYFSEEEKDTINDETCELLEPYLRFDADPDRNWSPWDFPPISPEQAAKASGAAQSLSLWVRSMVAYHQETRALKPQLDDLRLREARLARVTDQLRDAEDNLVGRDILVAGRMIGEALASSAAARDAPKLVACARAPLTWCMLQLRERSAFLACLQNPLPVDVQTMSGESFVVLADPLDTVLQLKERIREQRQVPVPFQQLFLAAKELQESQVLADSSQLPAGALPGPVTLIVSKERFLDFFVQSQPPSLKESLKDPEWQLGLEAFEFNAQSALPRATVAFCRAVADWQREGMSMRYTNDLLTGTMKILVEVERTQSYASQTWTTWREETVLRLISTSKGHVALPAVDVVAVLARLGSEHARETLRRGFRSKEDAVRSRIVEHLIELSSGNIEDDIVWLLDRHPVAWALRAVEWCLRRRFVALSDGLRSKLARCTERSEGNWNAQKVAILILGRLDQERRPHLVSALMARLDLAVQYREPRVMKESLELLTRTGPEGSEPGLSELLQRVRQASHELTLPAVELLLSVPGPEQLALAAFVQLVEDRDWALRLRALQALADVPIGACEPLVEAVRACAEGDWPSVRRAAQAVLARLD